MRAPVDSLVVVHVATWLPSQEGLLAQPTRLKEQIEQMDGQTPMLRDSLCIVLTCKQAMPSYWHTGSDDRSDNV